MKHIDVTNIQWVVNAGTFQPWSTAALRITMFLWLGIAVALTTLHVALQGNLVTVKELLVMMVPSIPWNLLIRSWAGSVSLGRNGG